MFGDCRGDLQQAADREADFGLRTGHDMRIAVVIIGIDQRGAQVLFAEPACPHARVMAGAEHVLAHIHGIEALPEPVGRPVQIVVLVLEIHIIARDRRILKRRFFGHEVGCRIDRPGADQHRAELACEFAEPLGAEPVKKTPEDGQLEGSRAFATERQRVPVLRQDGGQGLLCDNLLPVCVGATRCLERPVPGNAGTVRRP